MDAPENYVAPTSIGEAAELLQRGDVTVLAGGTDLMPQSHAGKAAFKRTLMNIRRIRELQGVAQVDGEIRIGALTTITELMENDLIRRHLPVLVDAADHFASVQIRNAGTVGGNVCNASPAGDMLIPLLVLDARVELVSKPNGAMRSRTLPLAEFFTGPGRTRREPNELLAAVRMPVPDPDFRAAFIKFGTRPALDISAVSLAVAGVRRDNALTAARVAFGAVAPTPIRGKRTEAALEGRRLNDAAIAEAAEAAAAEVTPISDVRASAWYRRELIRNLTERALRHVADA